MIVNFANNFFLFITWSLRGLAIDMRETVYGCPNIEGFLNDFIHNVQPGFLQNLPSIVCGHELVVQPDHLVLGNLLILFDQLTVFINKMIGCSF